LAPDVKRISARENNTEAFDNLATLLRHTGQQVTPELEAKINNIVSSQDSGIQDLAQFAPALGMTPAEVRNTWGEIVRQRQRRGR